MESGTDPTLVIGGEVDYLHSNSVLGKGEYVIAEADESDGSFLKEHPYIAVITNIDADHMDYYGTLANVIHAFKEFINRLDPVEGLAVLCADDDRVRAILPEVERLYVTYGIEAEADYRAGNIGYEEGKLVFDVFYHEQFLGSLALNVPGNHNILNALATVAAARSCGIGFDEIAGALSHFHGAKRRFQTKGHVRDIWVVDDYAHHPTEINATLSAARSMGTHRVVCLFQPHRYTRTQLLADEFSRAFVCADKLILTDIYGAGEEPIPGVDGAFLTEKVKAATGQDVVYVATKDGLLNYLRENAKPRDLILTMGAGDIYKVGEAFVAAEESEK